MISAVFRSTVRSNVNVNVNVNGLTAFRSNALCLSGRHSSTNTSRKTIQLLETATKPIPRRTVTPTERATLRTSRKQQATEALALQEGSTAAASTTSNTQASTSAQQLIQNTRYAFYVAITLPPALLIWALTDPQSPPAKLSSALGITSLISSFTSEYTKPTSTRLLPDWTDIPNVPHDIPVPHTLVLDLENTLVHSTWSKRYGWRHAKRPGVDKFLKELSQYYEIVLYSPSMDAVAEPVVDSLDKFGCIMHRLYRENTHYQDGIHMKDLKSLNRRQGRMVVIDDDPRALGLGEDIGNLIRIRPYENVNDLEDGRTLERLIPFLIEIARESYDNVPELLSQFVVPYEPNTNTADDTATNDYHLLKCGTNEYGVEMRRMDAEELVTEYENRIQRMTELRQERISGSNFGKMVHSSTNTSQIVPELPPDDTLYKTASAAGAPGQPLTAKSIVNAAPGFDDMASPTDSGSKGGIFSWLDSRQKEQEEGQTRKMEKWNEVMMKKQAQQKEAMEAAQAQAQAQSQVA